MDPNPVTLRPDDNIGIAADKFMQRRYRSLAVVDEKGCFLGVVTVNSLLFLVLPKAATIHGGVESLSYMNNTLADLRRRFMSAMEKPVSSCLITNPPMVAPETSLVETLLTLYREKSNLPVVDRETGRLEGMISYYDIGEKILDEGNQPG